MVYSHKVRLYSAASISAAPFVDPHRHRRPLIMKAEIEQISESIKQSVGLLRRHL
jgi:hypothetical protein